MGGTSTVERGGRLLPSLVGLQCDMNCVRFRAGFGGKGGGCGEIFQGPLVLSEGISSTAEHQ